MNAHQAGTGGRIGRESGPSRAASGRSGLPRAVTVGLVSIVGLLAGGCMRLGSDASAVRDAVMAAAGADASWEENVEIRFGVISMSLARGVARFADVPDEARAAMESARRVEVGVYDCRGSLATATRSRMMRDATAALEERGWIRIAAVIDGKDMVGLFMPDLDPPPGVPVQVCAVVFDGRELVIASARIQPEPLVAMILEERQRDRVVVGGANEEV